MSRPVRNVNQKLTQTPLRRISKRNRPINKPNSKGLQCGGGVEAVAFKTFKRGDKDAPGQCDIAKCFYCNGGLQNWDPEDEPWTEHAKWFPGCEYVIRRKGVDFVRNLEKAHPNLSKPYIRSSVSYDIPSTAEVQRAPMSHANENITSSRININQVINMGFSRKQIDNTIRRGEYNTTEELVNDLLEYNCATLSLPHDPSSILERTVQAQPVVTNAGTKRGVGMERATTLIKRTSSPAEYFSTEGQSDKAKCFYCNGGVQNWHSENEPWTEHAERFPGGECSTTGAYDMRYCDLANQHNMATPWETTYFFANVSSPEHNALLQRLNLQKEADRRKTFLSWPSYLALHLPGQLSRNGFFYLGNSDRIECFSCHGTLSGWPSDECGYGMHRLHFVYL